MILGNFQTETKPRKQKKKKLVEYLVSVLGHAFIIDCMNLLEKCSFLHRLDGTVYILGGQENGGLNCAATWFSARTSMCIDEQRNDFNGISK